VRVSLSAPAIDLQIAQDECAFAVALQKNEWIRRPKFRGIKYVRIRLAGGDDQACGFGFCFVHGDKKNP
jgi:hypothetical protein